VALVWKGEKNSFPQFFPKSINSVRNPQVYIRQMQLLDIRCKEYVIGSNLSRALFVSNGTHRNDHL